VQIDFCHSGFTDGVINFDEKRFQQVLLNFQSNALKFINSKEGRIQIVLSRFRPNEANHLRDQVVRFFGFDLIRESYDARKSIDTTLDPYSFGLQEDMMVLSVLDNGIGIKQKDQTKLF